MDDSSVLNLVAEKQNAGSAQGTNYQQFMNDQKHLGSQGDSQEGVQDGNYQYGTQVYDPEYQKYMQKGGGDYQKYMQRGGARNAMELTSRYMQQGRAKNATEYKQYMNQYSRGGARSGNYQQYLEQPGGDYRKYMQQGGGWNDSSVLNLVAKRNAGSAQGTNDQKYWSIQGDSQKVAQGGNYQHFTQLYDPEYQKYMQKGGGDYQQHMQRDGARNALELTSEDIKQLDSGKWPPLRKNMTRINGLKNDMAAISSADRHGCAVGSVKQNHMPHSAGQSGSRERGAHNVYTCTAMPQRRNGTMPAANQGTS